MQGVTIHVTLCSVKHVWVRMMRYARGESWSKIFLFLAARKLMSLWHSFDLQFEPGVIISILLICFLLDYSVSYPTGILPDEECLWKTVRCNNSRQNIFSSLQYVSTPASPPPDWHVHMSVCVVVICALPLHLQSLPAFHRKRKRGLFAHGTRILEER